MSQYGAYGFALRGWAYDRILGYYYPGTVLASVPASRVRVLLAEGRDTLAMGSHAPFAATDAGGRLVTLEAGTYRLVRTLELEVGASAVRLVRPCASSQAGLSPAVLGYARPGSRSPYSLSGLLPRG